MDSLQTSHELQAGETITTPLLIQSHVSLAQKNWFQTGGTARFLSEPTTISEFQAVLRFASAHQLPIFVLGLGANLLVADEGFEGMVIRPLFTDIRICDETADSVIVQAGAGVTMEQLITWCLDHHLLGLEEFSGIPGTVGGSVFINLHYFEFFLGDFLTEATIINRLSGTVTTVSHDWFKFGYDQSALHDERHYIINASFKLKKATAVEAAYARGRSTEIIRHRHARYPRTNTCGSFFRNFHEHEVSLTIHGKKIIYVAYYLDKIGIKGALSVGNAHVSHQHANMIITKENATSTDVILLARTMQEMVYRQFGIIPQPECRLLGFNSGTASESLLGAEQSI